MLSVSVLRLGRSSSLARPSQAKSHCKFFSKKSFHCSILINSSTNLTVKNSPSRVGVEQIPAIPKNENLAPAPIDPSIDKWFFISGAAN
jgi:hypothetical protein